MVVGMQHQQQQPHASPATVLEDATTPCAASPLLLASSKKNEIARKQETISEDNGSSKGCSVAPPPSSKSDIVDRDACEPRSEKVTVKTGNEMVAICCTYPVKSIDHVKLRDVNPHLVCVLCHGYFVDATSIAECLHTFCRSCIILHLATRNYCPMCETLINSSKPHLSLKPDKTLQDIVYKIVPGLFHDEMRRRTEFYEKHPNRDLELHPESRGITVDRLLYSSHDTFCISLVYNDNEQWGKTAGRIPFGNCISAPNSDSDGDDDSPKKYLMCPAAVRVMDLKKLIRMKYSLDGKNKVELFFRRESLPDGYSLMDIAYIYAWKRNSPIQLFYKISVLTTISLNSKEQASVTVITPDTAVKSSQIKSAALVDASNIDSKLHENKSTDSISSETCENSVPSAAKPSVISESSAPTPDLVISNGNIKAVPSDNKPTTSTTPLVSANKAPNVPSEQSVSSSAPRVTTKLKIVEDPKKCKSKSPIKCPTGSTLDASPIKSYLAISSIMNEMDRPDTKKVPLTTNKNCARKIAMSESNQAVVSTSDAVKVSKPISSSDSGSSKVVPVTNISPKLPINSLTSIVKSLNTNSSPVAGKDKNTNSSPVAGKENHKVTTENVNSVNNLMTVKAKTVTPSVSVPTTTATTSSPSSALNNKIIAASLVTMKNPTVVTQTTTSCSAKQKSTTVTTSAVASVQKTNVSNSSPYLTSVVTSGNSIKPKLLPKLLPATVTSSSTTNVQVTTTASKQISNTSINNSFTKATVANPSISRSYTMISSTGNCTKFSIVSSTSVPTNTTNTCVAKTVTVPSVPPLIVLNSPKVQPSSTNVSSPSNKSNKNNNLDLNSTNVQSSSNNVKSSSNESNKNNSLDPVNSFIRSTNAKIPSSLEISLTQSKNASNISPMSNLQKMVQQNFPSGNAVAGNHQQMNSTVKRSMLENGEGPKEKYLAASGKAARDNKKQTVPQPSAQIEKVVAIKNDVVAVPQNTGSTPPKKVFSADILPEVSITLNPHPESTNKRLIPETSYDVSCFKPFGTSNGSGVPPLTPITPHSVTLNTMASKSIMKSPIKRSLLNSRKGSPVVDEDGKKCNGSPNEEVKRPRLENGKCTPPLTKNEGGDKVSPMASSVPKKDGVARHQGIPQLIDINAPFAKSRLKLAANSKPNLTSALTIKPPSSTDKPINNALDLTSPTSSKSPVPTLLFNNTKVISPEKKKLLPTSATQKTTVTTSKPSPQQQQPSVGRVEQKLLSPISAKIEQRKISPKAASSTTSVSNRKRQFPVTKGVRPILAKLPTADKVASMDANVVGRLPSPATLSTAVPGRPYAPPNMLGNFFADPMTVNLLRQQQWMFNMNQAIPPHPLMNPFATDRGTLMSQNTPSSNSTKK